ncbi:Hypothetical protein PAU_00058 [Photorhabdus asymbiotica]|uniref:Uncharacterized protein n=1 Tax=Photorhabdus asymbiotica subsp. asymbiotica (strain ATCC 43949 / 3105-77) TaxID=553480 RepID=C7BU71_PHOAA|nr:Hypothetical protein PAU_00058 [Photorhabdus asymbiotica]
MPAESSPYWLFSAWPDNVYQRCVGQWWRIIGRSSALASVYLQKTFVRVFFQQILYFWWFFYTKTNVIDSNSSQI